MRNTFDFAPYRRSSIGFDRLFDLLESTHRTEQGDGYPPFDIEQRDEDRYRISVAVAGFGRDEIDITSKPNLLIVSGQKGQEADRRYLYRGIANRAFERQFHLADYVSVTHASLRDGLLEINLKREIPEAVKPRKIEIDGTADNRQHLTNDNAERQHAA